MEDMAPSKALAMKRRYTDQQVIDAVRVSYSIAQVLRLLSLSPTGANYRAAHSHFVRLRLDTSHFTGQGHLRGRSHSWTPMRPLADILVLNSTYLSTADLKARLIREGILANRCYECDSPPLWRGRPLVLVLDHINGDHSDNRVQNLRLLCPNCNSQQPTFAGRNRGRYRTGCRNGSEAQCFD
jgi:hypothetical protein